MGKARNNGLTIKQDRFIDETIRTANPTEAAVLVYNVKDRIVGNSVASENLRKPLIQEELKQRMIDNGVNADFLIQKHKRNTSQASNLAASNTALDMFYKILGAYAPERKIGVNIDLTTDDTSLSEAIKDLTEQVAKLEKT